MYFYLVHGMYCEHSLLVSKYEVLIFLGVTYKYYTLPLGFSLLECRECRFPLYALDENFDDALKTELQCKKQKKMSSQFTLFAQK